MTPSILIVDDSLTVRMDLGEAFELGGFACTLCSTAAGAREALSSRAFDLVVIDVLLPDADGLDLLKEVKSARMTTPVILLSSEAEVRDRVRGLKTGADEYVGKPYDRTYIVSRARELLRRTGTPESAQATRVLIIDDSPTFREALKKALEDAGYAVTAAISGEDGLRAAVDTRPAAMIVDGVLPGIDGATVIRRVRADALLRRTPCILLTGSDDHTDELRALDAGADAYVRKTEATAIILARLTALLRSSAASHAIEFTSSLLGPKKILAVDDSVTYLHEVAAELRHEGYDVVLARSGEEALELLAAQSVDCILLDLMMPGLSGQETCRRIRSESTWRDIPLIMHTSLEERDAMIECINAGADDYITKSGEFEVLRARMRAQLRRKQFEDENRSIREQLLQRELEAAEARSTRELTETREKLLTELRQRNAELTVTKTELEQNNLRLKEADRMKSEFLANMSHELRTPLNSIIGFSEVLIDAKFGSLNERQHRFMQNVNQSGRHLLGLINDLLDQSKIEAGRLQIMRQPCDVAALATEAVATLQPLADAKKLTITVESDERSAMPLVFADAVRFKQVLYNLISNAIKFTPNGGRIDVAAVMQDGKYVRTSVRDSGPGIAADEIDQLFTPFTQLDRTRDARASGTGLGLALSKRLVELMDGRIGVESAVGSGALFFVDMPVYYGRVESAPQATKVDDEAPLALIVDDEANARELIDIALKDGGYRTVVASTATEALRLARTAQPAIITLDVFMPGINGWQLLQTLQNDADTAAIPVVMVSISNDRQQAFSLGAIEHLVKPIGRQALIDALDRHRFTMAEVKHPVRVLVIDDDPAQLDLVRAALEPQGFVVTTALSGRSGLDTALAGHIDLLLLDLILPDLSGVEIIDALRSNASTRDLPILLITGQDLDESALTRLNVDVQAVLTKSSQSTNNLLSEVNRALERNGRAGRNEQDGQNT